MFRKSELNGTENHLEVKCLQHENTNKIKTAKQTVSSSVSYDLNCIVQSSEMKTLNTYKIFNSTNVCTSSEIFLWRTLSQPDENLCTSKIFCDG